MSLVGGTERGVVFHFNVFTLQASSVRAGFVVLP